MGDWKALWDADGEYAFIRIEEYERDGMLGHDVEVIRITDLVASGCAASEDIDKHGAFIAEGASWWPIEEVTRDERIKAAQSAGSVYGWRTALLPDDAAYIADRRKLYGWDVALATRKGITPEQIDDEEKALRCWADASLERRAEMLLMYFGGDRIGYGDGVYTSLALAMDAAGVPRNALTNTADYNTDTYASEGWGKECSHKHCIADHIWPRERHMQIVAQLAMLHWTADRHEEASSLMKHLDTLARKYYEDEATTPDWYLGAGVFGEEYLTLLPDYPI